MGFFEEFYCKEDAQSINENRLRPMYEKWSEIINLTLEKASGNEYENMTSPSLLTCSDSYMKQDKKIMLIGKEAHHDNGSLGDVFLKNTYLTDKYYKYEYEISRGIAKETFFLRTRRLLSGITDYKHKSYPDANEAFAVTSLLVNNLNKTSDCGKRTVCSDDLRFVYEPFEADGWERKANVFIHELNILKPDILVMLTGRDYEKHIKRAFGEEFYEHLVSKNMFNISIKEKPISEIIEIDREKVKEWYGIENYSFKVIYGFHPSARMSRELRNKYEVALWEAIR